LSPAAGANRRPELADVVRVAGERFRQTHRLSGEQRRALSAIACCRTAALGGHIETCDACGCSRAVYHSCRNRHCPKCQVLAKERWLAARCAELLPIPYFHVVFTLPHALNPLAQRFPKAIYGLLFAAAAATLQAFGRDPKHLGGTLGITAVLHTWSQTLNPHVHLHCVVTGGALAPDGRRWLPAQRRFLFPVKALSRVFRGKFLAGLAAAVGRDALPADTVSPFFRARLRRHPWVVYAKPPFGGPEQVLTYLGRYTHRIALSNDRIVALRDGVVQLRYRDSADGSRTKILHLSADELLRRFCWHVLPTGFMRLRHFGLLANRHRGAKLAQARALLGTEPPPATPAAEPSTPEVIEALTGVDISRCPICGEGRMHVTATWAAGEPMPTGIAILDTS
jgi:hypothetical protein